MAKKRYVASVEKLYEEVLAEAGMESEQIKNGKIRARELAKSLFGGDKERYEEFLMNEAMSAINFLPKVHNLLFFVVDETDSSYDICVMLDKNPRIWQTYHSGVITEMLEELKESGSSVDDNLLDLTKEQNNTRK